jgi:precorrin-6Y C5,15-methyltransferase (decarboxylating)
VAEAIAVVGLDGGSIGSPGALDAITRAELLVGSPRHLEGVGCLAAAADTLVLGRNGADLDTALDRIASAAGRVCVLASGDPGFFGIVRPLADRFGAEALEVHPSVSSVALAFARLGLPWDDAVVVSAHGRPLDRALAALAGTDKAAVLVSPDSPPEAVGAALVGRGSPFEVAYVCSRLGTPEETVSEVDLATLAHGLWDPLSVVVLLRRELSSAPVLSWGLPEAGFAHRGGMVTKAEVRAVVLGKLELPASGVVWDVGAGSASVAIECARLCPRLRVLAVEADPAAAERARYNVVDHGVAVDVVVGRVPAALEALPDPDRVFVGGGGIEALDAALGRVRRHGRVVATYSALDRAALAADRLGSLVQIGLSRGAALPGGGWRLAAENPVFVAWGPHP